MSLPTSSHSFSTFAEFWDYYLSEHQHPVNQAFHVIGTVGGLVCVALTIGVSWRWGFAILPVGYGLAWLGHIGIERNLPATLKYPLWSLRADYRMVSRLIRGRPLRTTASTQNVNEQIAA